MLSDNIAQDFLDKYLLPANNPGLQLPQFQEEFTLTTLNPATSGAKGGIRVLQLKIPYRFNLTESD